MSTFDNSYVPETRPALVVSHPGHELLVHGWLEEAQPIVLVITDGSGRSVQSRLASTTRILSETGARSGSIYGRLTDAEAYTAILNHDFDLFANLVDELCEVFVEERIDCVAGDALEGYNPMHDVCRLVINAAVTAASLRGQRVANYEFSLIGQPDACCNRQQATGIWRQLDRAAFARKLKAAQGYAELSGEVLAALTRTSAEAFRMEHLHSVDLDTVFGCEDPPFYELYGEKQVAAGHYDQVIRYREHILPLAQALGRIVERSVA